MDRKPHIRTTRRIASMVFGSLAIIAMAASPMLAHVRVSTGDTPRHALLAAELFDADQDEAAEVESLLEAEDGPGDANADETDAEGVDEGDQGNADEVDANEDDQGADTDSDDGEEADATETDSGGEHDGGEVEDVETGD